MKKTEEEIKKQTYITAEDLQIIMPIGYDLARSYIKEIRAEMQEKGYYVPNGRKLLALTKLAKKKFGF